MFLSFLIYCVLDDIMHREINILIPLFVTIVILIINPSLFVFISLVLVFSLFYTLPLFVHLLNKVFTKNKTIKEYDSINKKQRVKERVVGFPSYISKVFNKYSGMGAADPWIFSAFLLFIPVFDWILYLLIVWVLIILFFIAKKVLNIKNESIKIFFIAKKATNVKTNSLPLAPILLLSLSIYLLFLNFFF
ncbi:hypothetical protein [Bacillus cereus]|uniref:hypothetical protein n=1 Tax=Bacillus cereus TaxID=1396 RepID=UPI000B4C1EA4|nr:hypothetical protein [Bacillus cereus]